MSSENEMVDQSGENQPEENVEPQQPELASEPETAVVSDVVAKDEQAEGELDWDAWLLANPEEEEISPVVESEAEPEIDSPSDEITTADVPVEEAVEAELVEATIAEMDGAADVSDEISEQSDEPITDLAEDNSENDIVETVDEALAQPEETVVEAAEVAEDAAPIADEADGASGVEPSVATDVEPSVVKETPKPTKVQKKRNPHGLKAKDVIRYFAPCGRCGYFLTGYRAAYGEADFETAVAESEASWLTLSWGNNVRELILKAYGTEVETNDLHFSNCCSECRRTLTYFGAADEDQSPTFRVEIKPQGR